MTPLRQRMLEDMQLRGFSPRTREAYVRAVHQLAAHFHRPPDRRGEDELREYFLYLSNVKHFARASFTIALCGIKFFDERTLSREWKVFDLVRPGREKKLPATLSRDEVRRILGCVRLPVYRACLTPISAGLRKAGLLEQVPLAVWRHEWVVHVQHAGTGEQVLDYLARYVFRIAIVNSRLEQFEDGHVTFRYRDGQTGLLKRCTLDAVAFLGRFLQHVLPQGFTKVRHSGLFSPSRHDLLAQARKQLIAVSASPPPDQAPIAPATTPAPDSAPHPRCAAGGIGVLHIVETLRPCGRSP